MKTNATYFVNDEKQPLRYGEINLINPKRKRLRGEEAKEGIECIPVFCGFCGTDLELMRMGQRGELCPKFPEGESRLINGHEGVVWVPSQNRFAIVLIRGGDSYDDPENRPYLWEGKDPSFEGYFRWAKGEPTYVDNDDTGRHDEDYIMLWDHNGWAYNDNRDDPCHDYPEFYSGTMGYVCEFND